jgi:hypothetical protein
MYVNKVGGGASSYYLEVSRRSTLLPSLGPLEEESFHTLFRQYRSISLIEFLSSLGLEEYLGAILEPLALQTGEEAAREDDFMQSRAFRRLVQLPQFQELYENERIRRKKAFVCYLKLVSKGIIPSRLVIVDVGWKGTIQDNLYRILCDGSEALAEEIIGYYIGLVSQGLTEKGNVKHGLIFSIPGKRSPKYRIFNENRALFETILAADHGSIQSYGLTAEGHGYAIRGTFDEKVMIDEYILPLQKDLFQQYRELLWMTSSNHQHCRADFKKVVKGHSRMVFKPTQQERRWFSSIYHVENFGVFEQSTFTVSSLSSSVMGRILFILRLVHRRRQADLGFWPWNTIYEKSGLFPAMIYGMIRRFQA